MGDVPESMREGRDRVAERFITGEGIEIGPGNSPIRLHSSITVKHVDRSTKESLVGVQGFADDWSEPDIVDDGEVLSSIADNSIDFIIACHVLEHTQDPLSAMQAWLSKIRPGGVLFLAIPDRRHSFDRDRPLTSFEHLVSDYRLGPAQSEDDHLHEWVTVVNGETDDDLVAAQKAELRKIDYRIHYHVWDTNSFIETIVRSNGMVGDFDIEYCGFNWMEAVTVLRKRPNAADRPATGALRTDALEPASPTVRSALERTQSDLEIARTEIDSLRQAEAMLRGRLARQEKLLESLQRRADDISLLKAEVGKLERFLSEAQEKIDVQKREIRSRFDELATVTKALLEEEQRAEAAKQTADQLLEITRVLLKRQPWWLALAPSTIRRKRTARQLARSGSFDPVQYAERFPDVIAAGHDPFRHYIYHGIDEMRSGTR